MQEKCIVNFRRVVADIWWVYACESERIRRNYQQIQSITSIDLNKTVELAKNFLSVVCVKNVEDIQE